jgi:hypothetical protein
MFRPCKIGKHFANRSVNFNTLANDGHSLSKKVGKLDLKVSYEKIALLSIWYLSFF